MPVGFHSQGMLFTYTRYKGHYYFYICVSDGSPAVDGQTDGWLVGWLDALLLVSWWVSLLRSVIRHGDERRSFVLVLF